MTLIDRDEAVRVAEALATGVAIEIDGKTYLLESMVHGNNSFAQHATAIAIAAALRELPAQQLTSEMIEAAATAAYERNRAGTKEWCDISDKHRVEWRTRVKPVLNAGLTALRKLPAKEQAVPDIEVMTDYMAIGQPTSEQIEAAAFQIQCELGCTITAARITAHRALAAAAPPPPQEKQP